MRNLRRSPSTNFGVSVLSHNGNSLALPRAHRFDGVSGVVASEIATRFNDTPVAA